LVGVRTLCLEEKDYIRSKSLPTFSWPSSSWPSSGDGRSLLRDVLDRLGPEVYVSIDLDVLDPSLMAAVGTPEPGGMDWYQVTSLLRGIAESRRIVGFDVSELSPGEGPAACSYTAAKLVYKLVAYATVLSDNELPQSP
jgi:agmatinase